MTNEELKNYYEGKGCQCCAHNASECGCDDVDWTPKEVYELREDLEFRRQLYKVQAAQLDKIRSERDEAQDAIAGWDNKWKCAVEMAARAENERNSLKVALEEISNLAKTLKAERDEAREEIKEWKTLCLWGGTPEHIHGFIRGQQSRIQHLERERDEAFELLASEKITRNHIIKRSVEVERERDEAREEANKLSGAYEDATNYYARIIELKEELDEAREKLSAAWQSLRDSQDEVLRLTFENRELRNLSNE